MSAFENATRFFHACEQSKGWEACREYAAEDAVFSAQAEPLVEIDTVQAYTEWMAAVGNGPLAGASYEIHASSYDDERNAAMFFATFTGRHVGEGGPVPPTDRETRTHYVYVLEMDDDGRVRKMTKIWNAPWALRELGWM